MGPDDPYFDPPAPLEQASDAWSWVPEEWNQAAAVGIDAPAPPPSDLQPGLGIPTATLDAVPLPAAAPAGPVPMGDLQPGLGIPTSALDAVQIPPPQPPQPEPVQAPLIPDAVSGVGEDAVSGVGEVLYPPTDAVPELPGEYMADSEKSSEQLLEDRMRADAAAKEKFADERLAAIKADRESREINERAHAESYAKAQAASAQLDADVKQLFSEKLDRGKWWADRSGEQKVAAVLSGIIGGLWQSSARQMKSGASNPGLDMIIKMQDQDIEDQKFDLQHRREGLGVRRGLVAEMYARTGDINRAAETARVAQRENLLQQLEIEQQNYDPAGKLSSDIEVAKRQLRAQAAADRDKRDQERQKTEFERSKFQLENDKHAETVRHNKATEDAAARRAASGAGSGSAKGKGLVSVEEAKRLYGIDIPEPLPQVQVNQRIEGLTKAHDLTQKRGEETPERRRERELGIGGIVDDKGEVVKFRTPEFAGKLAKTKGAVDNAVRLIDDLIRARQKYGWSSDLLKSPEWREAQTNFSELILTKKDTDELGVLAGPDLGLITGGLSTTDPTEVRDPTSGLKVARRNFIEKFNKHAEAQAVLPEGHKFVRYNIPFIEPAAPELSAQDKLQKQALQEPVDPKTGHLLPEERRLDPAVKSHIERLGASAIGNDDAERSRAVGALEAITKNSLNVAAKQMAQQLLNNAITTGIFPSGTGPPNPDYKAPE